MSEKESTWMKKKITWFMNKEIGTTYCSLLLSKPKKMGWNQVRDTLRFKRDVCVIFMQRSFENLLKNLMQI